MLRVAGQVDLRIAALHGRDVAVRDSTLKHAPNRKKDRLVRQNELFVALLRQLT
jgi:hypothetical protein